MYGRLPRRSPDQMLSDAEYSSEVQQPLRATAVMSEHQHMCWAAPLTNQQGHAGSLHPEGRAPYVPHPMAKSGRERSQTGMSRHGGMILERRVLAGHRLNCLLRTGGQGQGRNTETSSECRRPTGTTVSQLPEPRPQTVAREPEPRCQASTGIAHCVVAGIGSNWLPEWLPGDVR